MSYDRASFSVDMAFCGIAFGACFYGAICYSLGTYMEMGSVHTRFFAWWSTYLYDYYCNYDILIKLDFLSFALLRLILVYVYRRHTSRRALLGLVFDKLNVSIVIKHEKSDCGGRRFGRIRGSLAACKA